MITADDCEHELKLRGWSVGDVRIVRPAGLAWQVLAHRDGQRVIARAPTQAEAWEAAARSALAINAQL